MATKKTASKARTSTSKKPVSVNPTLHGLMIARTFSGTVVRVLTFAILVFAVALAGAGAADGYSTGNAIGTWALISAAYLVFDVLYVLMTRVRPLHPRLDRVVLPLALVFALIVIFTPLVMVASSGLVGLWITGGVALLAILGVRLALLIAASNRS